MTAAVAAEAEVCGRTGPVDALAFGGVRARPATRDDSDALVGVLAQPTTRDDGDAHADEERTR